MNLEAAQPRDLESWPRRHWLMVIGWIIVAQLALIFLFSQRSRWTPREDHAPLHVELAAPSGPVAARHSWTISDPTLFALIHPRSFSRAGWLDFSLMEHQLNDWQEPPFWLNPEAAQFGARFHSLIATSRLGHLLIEDKPLPQVTRLELPLDKPPPTSTLTIEGELAQRRLINPALLPAWPHHELLAPSLVQVMVDTAGNTLSARLVGSSGLRLADQRAVELALQFQYEPLPATTPASSRTLTWGQINFRWFTTELPPATNTPARLAP